MTDEMVVAQTAASQNGLQLGASDSCVCQTAWTTAAAYFMPMCMFRSSDKDH